MIILLYMRRERPDTMCGVCGVYYKRNTGPIERKTGFGRNGFHVRTRHIKPSPRANRYLLCTRTYFCNPGERDPVAPVNLPRHRTYDRFTRPGKPPPGRQTERILQTSNFKRSQSLYSFCFCRPAPSKLDPRTRRSRFFLFFFCSFGFKPLVILPVTQTPTVIYDTSDRAQSVAQPLGKVYDRLKIVTRIAY